MADVALGFLLQNLTTMLSGEIKLVRGFEDAMSKLQKSLIQAQGFLSDAEEKEIRDRSVRDWLKDLEDVAFEADDVLDEFNYHLFQNKLKHQKQGPKKVTCFSSSSASTSLFSRRKMAQKINVLNAKFNNVNKEAERKGLEKMVVTAPDASTVGLDETNSYSVESCVVGRESDVDEIVEMVLNAPLQEKISVLPIVGMGGLGKTTLTRLVYHHKKIKSRFEKKIWICVSLNFDELTLFRNIYSSLSGESVQLHDTTDFLLEKIQKLLESKRFLLILDDVWNDDSKKWEDFLKSLLGICTATQNVIVVTTRGERVASSLVKTFSPYELRGLSDDECWSIIKAKALSGIEGQLQYEDIGQQFGERCGGLPLAAQVIGGILCDLPKEDWSSVLTNELPNFVRDDTNHIMRILKVSYNRLPSSLLKKCFVYSSVFPQDFKINKKLLIEQWLGEGFLQTNQENVSMEAIGNKIFNHLVQASLFQESERDILGNITHCRMHDFVHDLAFSLSRGGGRDGTTKDGGNDISKVRYLYLQSRELHEISKEETKHLRTLIVDGKDADNMFQGHLRVLTLKNSRVQNLPFTIEKQIHMRFLDITKTIIEKLPDSINKLSNLQTLVVENLETLPNTIIDLPNLRHLYIRRIELPPFIGKLTSLQTLPYYVVGKDRCCKISELENLKNLKGELEISKLERVKDKGEAGHADLFGKSGILTLVLTWTSEREGDKNDMDVLDGLQPHPNLKSLAIRGYKSINFPTWTMKMTVHNAIKSRWEALTNLIEIKIVDCQCEEIPNLGHLPHLKFLTFESLPAVQSIGLSFYGLETRIDNANPLKITTPLFPALQHLRVSFMKNLTEWVIIESRVAKFPCLERLAIWSCPKLESAPTPSFPCLKDLQVWNIGSSNFPLAKICANTSSLQTLTIRWYSGIINIGDECFVKNPDLSYWEIRNCPNMMYIEQDSTTLLCFPLLKQLHIIDCPNLKSMPNFDLRLLEILQITGCQSLVDLPKLTNSPQLRNLTIGRFSQLMDADSFNDFLKRILHTSHRLETLWIYGNEEWVSLSDHIQHFHALQSLWVFDYGIESLPEWIGNFSSLQKLCIENCKRLHHLPSRETMQRLTKLSDVSISKCPLLAEKIRTQQETTPDDADNSEWSKISHIKDVEIDEVPYHQNSTPEAPPVQDKNKFAGCFPIPRNRKN